MISEPKITDQYQLSFEVQPLLITQVCVLATSLYGITPCLNYTLPPVL